MTANNNRTLREQFVASYERETGRPWARQCCPRCQGVGVVPDRGSTFRAQTRMCQTCAGKGSVLETEHRG